MNKVEKINNFIEKNNIQEIIYSYNKKIINNTNEYPEDYYAFEEKVAFSYVYDYHRGNKKLIYQGNCEEAFVLFLVKVLFLKYCRNNDLNKDVYNQEQKEISVIDNSLYYKEYKYFTFPNGSVPIEEVDRLNRRACYLQMFFKEIISEGLVKSKVEVSKILELLSK